MKAFNSLLTLLVCAAALCAQENNAVVSGDVLDASGAKVPEAVVTALNVNTGVPTVQKSNSAGVYNFLTLQPGLYRITAEKVGFKKLVMNDITLRVADHVEINLKLDVGVVSDTVQVVGDSVAVNYLTPTQGGLVNNQRIQALPTIGRSAMDFVTTQPGLVSGSNGINVNGSRSDALNVTLDGVNILDNVVNETIQNVQLNTTTDRIAEIAVITSPADAEFGRGSGQVIATSRSGTNKFHGSVFDQFRNSDLNGNTWANNRGSVVRPFRNENNPGARLDGPIKKNKIFIFGLYETDILRQHSTATATVPTDTARKGIFRFFPGVTNGNALAGKPTVDAGGNPLTPAGATGPLQTVSLFGLDPNRLAADTTGNVAKNLELLPSPNTFLNTGDGLNTAGYQWTNVVPSTLYSFSTRLDYNVSDKHRINLSYSRDYANDPQSNDASPLPTSAGGKFDDYAMVVSGGLTSTLSPTVVNQLTGGVAIATFDFLAPWSVSGLGILPSINSQPYLLGLSGLTSPYSTGTGEDPQGRKAPVVQLGDKISWIKGIHSLKAGFDTRFLTENNYVAFNVVPRVALGTGNVSSQNITTISGIGANGSLAVNLLNTLAGSVGTITQQFYSKGGSNPTFTPNTRLDHTWNQNELDGYFQDDIKLKRNLTVNLGVRWEYYGVPHEANGLMVGLQGGSSSIFGISGTTFSSIFNPGASGGALTQFQLIGANSPNSNVQPWGKNRHNFAPALGLAWNLPWQKFGMNKTVLRMGYGVSYERAFMVLLDQIYGFGAPGLGVSQAITPSVFTNLNGVSLPLTTTTLPLATVPINDNNSTTQTALIAANNLKTPYIQNWNVSLGREIGHGILVDFRYVGSKGTKLLRGTNIDEINVIENGILNAFTVTEAGGNSPLLNQIFKGLSIPSVGVVDGVNITGSQAMRGNSTLNAFLLSNNVGGFGSFLASNTFVTGIRGGLLKNGGLPSNFVVANPQFGAADLIGNFSSSTFHSAQFELNKRFGSGFQLQASYVFSKALGDVDGNSQSEVSSYLTLRNEHLDKRLLSFDVPNAIRTSGIWDLPFGPHRKFLSNTHGVVGHIVENWQTAVIFNKLSGTPTTFTGVGSTFNGLTGGYAVNSAPLPSGSVHFSGNNVLYFNGLTQVPDPSIQNIPANLQSQSSMFAIAGPDGKVLVQNAAPGQMGTLSPTSWRGLGTFTFNVQASKAVTLNAEHNVTLRLRADATNVLNRPIWGSPNLNINSTSFGLITSATGSRAVALTARIEF